jgi:hypothetical protein
MKNRFFSIIFVLTLFTFYIQAQNSSTYPNDKAVYGKVENGDTSYFSNIKEVIIMPKPVFDSKADYRRFQRLVRNVKKVYPFAKLAGQKYKVVEKDLLALNTDRERKEYLKKVEKDLIDQYEDDLSKLTITQGRILIKLIDREIGETSYDLLKEFRGNFNAIFWQTLARLFGHNLKTHFDPLGEDKELNQVLILIDNGML